MAKRPAEQTARCARAASRPSSASDAQLAKTGGNNSVSRRHFLSAHTRSSLLFFSPCQQRNSMRAGVELLPRRRSGPVMGLGPGGSGGATRRVAIVPDQPPRLFPLRTNCFFPLSTLNEEGLQRGGATLSIPSSLSIVPPNCNAFLCHLPCLRRVSSFLSLRSRILRAFSSASARAHGAPWPRRCCVGYSAGFGSLIHVAASRSTASLRRVSAAPKRRHHQPSVSRCPEQLHDQLNISLHTGSN